MKDWDNIQMVLTMGRMKKMGYTLKGEMDRYGGKAAVSF